MPADVRTLPYSLDAEESVLGGIIVENEAINDALPLITGRSFFREANRIIFDHMVAMRDRKIPIELVTLVEHLGRAGELEKVGGPAYVGGLASGVPRSTNVEHYAQIVHDKATLRALISAAHTIASEAYGASDEADEILNRAEAAVMAVAHTAVRGDFVAVEEIVRRASARFIEAHDNPRIVTGLSSGIKELDKHTRGLQPGEVTYLAAGTSKGKSALMMQMACAAAVQDVAGIVSLEMSADSLIDRAIAQLAGVDAFRMKTGHLSPYEQQRCQYAFDQLANTQLFVDDVVGLTATQMRAKVRRFASRKKLKSLFIDYVQLMHDAGKFSTRNEELTTISRGLKLMAIELHIPIVVLSQLSRAGTKDEERPPTLADLRESGALEQDADVVLLIWRHTENGEKVVDLIIAKQRNGPTGMIRLRWFAEQMRFASPDEAVNEPQQPEMSL
jgi:replicative DNA helicase